MDDAVKVVRDGYDALGGEYLDWIARIEGDPRHELVAAFSDLLPDGAQVVDLGCGPGVPSTRQLTERFEVVGIDVSPHQLATARAQVPAASFIEADLATFELPPATLDGVVALYSFGHLPGDDQVRLLGKIATWLKPGGLLLATLPTGQSGAWQGRWLGVAMHFATLSTETYHQALHEAGFILRYEEAHMMNEPGEGKVQFLWIIGEKQDRTPRREPPDG